MYNQPHLYKPVIQKIISIQHPFNNHLISPVFKTGEIFV